MKLFLALTLVANLHAPANAADLVAAAADDIDATATATPTQVDFNNQVDKTKTMPKLLRLRGMNPVEDCGPTNMSCTSNSNAAHNCRKKSMKYGDGYCLGGSAQCCFK